MLKLTCDILLSTSAFRFNLRRYNVAYILKQVEPVVCGGGDEDEYGDGLDGYGFEAAETPAAPAGVDSERWLAACRLRSGARGVFAAAEAPLDDASLLARGEWVDSAVADLLVLMG